VRVLVVNIFFDPYSFGGATVVAERMAHELSRSHGWEVTALAVRFANLPAVSTVRYRTKYGFDAFNVGMPFLPDRDYEAHFRNPYFAQPFRRIVDFVRPDVVHLHCIQEMDAGIIDMLAERGIPVAVTVHDFWWLCERQFMINLQGNYCAQRRIDYDICAACSGERARVERRGEYLKAQLAKADLILPVSEFTRGMLLDNDLPVDRMVVNRNGVQEPGPAYVPRRRSRKPGGPLHFGFIGGPGPIKGWDLIAKAFSLLDRNTYRLLAIDAGAAIGCSWRADLEKAAAGLSLEVLPSYNAETLDETFSRFDVLLAPSRWKETFGLAVREALIRDIWVIASDGGGLAEDIRQGVNGNVLPFPPTVEALRKAVEGRIEAGFHAAFDTSYVTTVDGAAKELSGLLAGMIKAPEVARA